VWGGGRAGEGDKGGRVHGLGAGERWPWGVRRTDCSGRPRVGGRGVKTESTVVYLGRGVGRMLCERGGRGRGSAWVGLWCAEVGAVEGGGVWGGEGVGGGNRYQVKGIEVRSVLTRRRGGGFGE